MRNKKEFNNIFDSICITLLFVCLIFYLVVIWFGVINPKEGTNPIATMIISTLVFGVMVTIIGILIIQGCYEYWLLSEDSIYSKKLFRNKIIIKLNENDRVEKKIVPALVMSTYKSKAYIIYSKSKKIVILRNERKKFYDLDFELNKFINE